jgi:Pyruvate/2-oxoacid:ferredoxin oxidoreductase delta subunit
VVLDELTVPLGVRHDALGTLVTCRRMRLGEPDESGRRRPIPETTEDAQFDLRCDRVILALGQAADLSLLPAGSEIRDGQFVLGSTAAPIFACGDFTTNEGTVAAAIGSGRRAAAVIHAKLSGDKPPDEDHPPVATPQFVRNHLFTHAPRQRGTMLPPARRRWGFDEVREGLPSAPDHASATGEARRCFSCGVCNFCDRCVIHCPEGIMVRQRDGYRFDESFCKGCGICMEECPRGVIAMSDASSAARAGKPSEGGS